MLLNLEPKSITLITNDGIFHKPNELSTLNYRIISQLSETYTSKEDLVKSVWGYDYDPLRHDSLIYSSLSSLRKGLNEDKTVIETSEVGYSLNATVVNLLDTTKPTSEKNTKSVEVTLQPSIENYLDHNLNARQIQIMQYLAEKQFVSVKTVTQIFSTSEITANRDLRALFQKKLVLRVGQGRATQYTKV